MDAIEPTTVLLYVLVPCLLFVAVAVHVAVTLPKSSTNGVTETDTIDLTHLFQAGRPSWMLTRYGAPKDVAAEEREEAAATGVTDAYDGGDGFGLLYSRVEDATAVAKRMANRLGEPFGVYGGRDADTASVVSIQWPKSSATELP